MTRKNYFFVVAYIGFVWIKQTREPKAYVCACLCVHVRCWLSYRYCNAFHIPTQEWMKVFSAVNSCFDASNDDDDDSSGVHDIIFSKVQAMPDTRLIRRVIIYILPWPIIFAWLNNMRYCIKLLALHNLHSYEMVAFS